MGGEGGERRDGRKEREENGEEDEDVYGPSISRYSMRLFFTAGARFKFNHPTFFLTYSTKVKYNLHQMRGGIRLRFEQTTTFNFNIRAFPNYLPIN